MTTRKIILCCLLIAMGGAFAAFVTAKNESLPFESDVYYPVTKVHDGDTFEIQTPAGRITIRMLGINTPETVDPRREPECYGKEASAKTKSLLRDASVRLIIDEDREVQDKYGRYLAYVYRSDDVFLNEYLLEEGYAREYTYGSAYDEQKAFRRAEADARLNNRGLWAKCVNLTGN